MVVGKDTYKIYTIGQFQLQRTLPDGVCLTCHLHARTRRGDIERQSPRQTIPNPKSTRCEEDRKKEQDRKNNGRSRPWIS